MNWSRLFGKEGVDGDVYVRHYHGNEKWTSISPREQPYQWPILNSAVKKNPEIALRVYQNEL